jgi:S-adenosylmethionine synthetase
MFEKVNPSHPDKIADRIAGALVDMAYAIDENPRIAVEVLVGHGACHIIAETSVELDSNAVKKTVKRIDGGIKFVDYDWVWQDSHLAKNQDGKMRCGDNGIFKGVPVTEEQSRLSSVVRGIYRMYPHDGKYIIDGNRIIACQSNVEDGELDHVLESLGFDCRVNPLGEWTGGTDVDSGAANRKLGSDMADSVTGGGLHGKDLSKADVSVNIYAWLKAQETGKPVELLCAIGDESVDGKPYSEIVGIAREFIAGKGGFEKFAEWGLV